MVTTLTAEHVSRPSKWCDQTANITQIALSLTDKRGAEKLLLYLHDWGLETRGRRFHHLIASPLDSQIHPHEFLKHNNNDSDLLPSTPNRAERGWSRSQQHQAKAWLLGLAMKMKAPCLKQPSAEVKHKKSLLGVCYSEQRPWRHGATDEPVMDMCP